VNLELLIEQILETKHSDNNIRCFSEYKRDLENRAEMFFTEAPDNPEVITLSELFRDSKHGQYAFNFIATQLFNIFNGTQLTFNAEDEAVIKQLLPNEKRDIKTLKLKELLTKFAALEGSVGTADNKAIIQKRKRLMARLISKCFLLFVTNMYMMNFKTLSADEQDEFEQISGQKDRYTSELTDKEIQTIINDKIIKQALLDIWKIFKTEKDPIDEIIKHMRLTKNQNSDQNIKTVINGIEKSTKNKARLFTKNCDESRILEQLYEELKLSTSESKKDKSKKDSKKDSKEDSKDNTDEELKFSDLISPADFIIEVSDDNKTKDWGISQTGFKAKKFKINVSKVGKTIELPEGTYMIMPEAKNFSNHEKFHFNVSSDNKVTWDIQVVKNDTRARSLKILKKIKAKPGQKIVLNPGQYIIKPESPKSSETTNKKKD